MSRLAHLETPILIALLIGLVIAGIGFVFAAAETPWHSDSDAYFAELAAIERAYYGPPPDPDTPFVRREGEINHEEASRRFHANQERFRTKKWLYADLGYSAVTWAALIGAWLLARASHPLERTPRLRALVMVVALGLSAGVALFASVMHAMGRQQLPHWADSVGIPLMGIVPITLAALVFGIVIALPVWLRRNDEAPRQLIWPRPNWKSSLVTLLYLPVVAMGALAISSAWSEAGWAGSLLGFFLIWLAVESRAAALSPSNPKPPIFKDFANEVHMNGRQNGEA